MIILLRLFLFYIWRPRAERVKTVILITNTVAARATKPFLLKYLVIGTLVLFVLVVLELSALGVGTYYYFLSTLPVPSSEAMMAMPEFTHIYDRNGELLYELHGDVKRRFVPLAEIPIFLQKATIAIEDKNFYTHHGYDLTAMMRAFYINYKHQGIAQGASTITQQLARTMFLSNDRDYIRKIREIILAIEIEKRFRKDEILEMYLNNIPYGSVAYGISAAAQIYLNKPASELSLWESAYLAALPKAPSDYSPFGNNRDALDRRAKEVISAMQTNGYLSVEEVSAIAESAMPNFVSSPHFIKAPHFVFFALDELNKTYGLTAVRDGGLDVYTSLDMSLQREAEKVVAKWGPINEKKYGATNIAMTAVDPSSGEILAMVGSRDYFDPKNGSFNVAISPRQPGSSFKPYVYGAAFSADMNPDSIVVDNQTDFAVANYGVSYIPQNYSGKHYGAVTARKALAGSLNVPAVKVLVSTGINKVIDFAESMGISTLGERNRFGPSLALGGAEVKLLEHTAAMGVFGNGGKKQELSAILKIKKRNGDLFYERKHVAGKQVVDERVAYWISDVLSDAKARQFIFGRGSNLIVPNQRVAVKTGTTQDFHDAWTVGFTPSVAVGVWTGNNDNHVMKNGADGSVVAAPIWKDFMTFALGKLARKDFVAPKGMGLLAVKKEPVKIVVEKVSDTTKGNDIDKNNDIKENFLSSIVSGANAMDEKKENTNIVSQTIENGDNIVNMPNVETNDKINYYLEDNENSKATTLMPPINQKALIKTSCHVIELASGSEMVLGEIAGCGLN